MKCRDCKHYHHNWCSEVHDDPHPDLERNCKHYKTATKADRIRQMTDEELSLWFDQLTNGCDSCPNKHDCTYSIESFGRCDDIWLSWLKQEISE